MTKGSMKKAALTEPLPGKDAADTTKRGVSTISGGDSRARGGAEAALTKARTRDAIRHDGLHRHCGVAHDASLCREHKEQHAEHPGLPAPDGVAPQSEDELRDERDGDADARDKVDHCAARLG